MKFIINGKYLTQKVTGVQRVAAELVAELDKLSGHDITLAAPKGAVFPELKNIKTVNVGKRQGVLWEQIDFCKFVKKENAISINLCNSAPLSGKKIVMIHDVKVKSHPEFFSFKFRLWYNFLFRNLVKKSLSILTVSEFSKREIQKYYKLPSSRVKVIPNGWQHFKGKEKDDSVRKEFSLEQFNYYFTMSSLEPNKNIKWIIETAKNNMDSIFVVAGGANKKVFAKNDIECPENVKLVGYVSDAQANDLLANCKAFLFPTFYEGFGMPPLEAMSQGVKNVIVTDSEVMHEIFEDSVVYINPEKYDYDLDELVKTTTGDKERILLKYSWEKSAALLERVLYDVEKEIEKAD
ncbi:MAG: glycosyltransferase family 1 protein [Clostridia bacterium]|nr:glycosyltransferase family 1 protein [Clostridia bacterium]